MTRILPFLLLCAAAHAAEMAFGMVFDDIIEHRHDIGFFHDAPYNPTDYSSSNTNTPMWNAISAISNHVDEAIAMVPSFATNALRRDVFLHMAGHAGTNAFLHVWECLIDIAETNSAIVSPEEIDRFRSGVTTPLEGYAVFHYDAPTIRSLLVRTRNLFPTNGVMWMRYEEILSGSAKAETLTYADESGSGLPFGAGQYPLQSVLTNAIESARPAPFPDK